MMFDQFISKIQNVQKDLYSNFNLSPKQKKEEISNIEIKSCKSIELSNHYQLKWNSLHQLMEQNINLIIDNQKYLKQLNNESNRQLELIQNFNLTIQSLDEIETSLNELDFDLNNVEKSIVLVESILVDYEKQRRLEYLKNLELNLDNEHKLNCKLKLNDFENYKIKLLDDHKKKAKEIEKLQLTKFKYKSNLYQNNFEKELDEFKRTGKLSIIKNQEPKLTKSLDDIIIDDDLKELDDFLNN